ncbi:hypothetical protein [Saccharopolyspora hattusasensis]|uniref:hypothetical protein n=1 Tax=Saccharopolyspora hattusasensis TaxID=1128679 RepID=UPI003D99F621
MPGGIRSATRRRGLVQDVSHHRAHQGVAKRLDDRAEPLPDQPHPDRAGHRGSGERGQPGKSYRESTGCEPLIDSSLHEPTP